VARGDEPLTVAECGNTKNQGECLNIHEKKIARMEIKIPGQDAEDIIEQLLGGSEDEALMQTLTKEKALVRIRLENRRGHYVTIVDFGNAEDAKQLGIKDMARELKKKLAAGGTIRDSWIEIQGDHRQKIKKLLIEMGFKEDNILIDEGVTET
jgi:translation initiation factor 1